MDAANHTRHIKVTAAAALFPEGCANPMAPANNHPYCYVEADDSSEAFATTAKPMADMTNEVIDDPNLDVTLADGTTAACKLRCFIGGDQKFIGGANSVSACSGPFPCAYCECPKDHLSDTAKTFPLRTRENIMLLAHAALGKCPGCSLEIVEVVKNKKFETKLLSRSDPAPCTKKGEAGLNKSCEYDPAALVVAELSRCGMEMKASKITDQTAQKLDTANMAYKSFSFVGRDTAGERGKTSLGILDTSITKVSTI
jgi:hypothetical protein